MRVGYVIAIAVVLVFVMVAVRVLVGGFHEDRMANQYLAEGNVVEAITAFDRSMHWYLPGSPTVARAAIGLEDIARKAESADDIETALRAWRVLRSGFYGARWIVQPGKQTIALCDENIARLVAVKVAAAHPEDAGAGQFAYEKEMAILTKKVGPNVAWSMAALAGFFGWIIFAGMFIFKAFGRQREFYRRPAVIYGLCFLAAYALWMISLSRA